MFNTNHSGRTISRNAVGHSGHNTLGQRLSSARRYQVVAESTKDMKEVAEREVAEVASEEEKNDVYGRHEGLQLTGGGRYQGGYDPRQGLPQRADGAHAETTLDEDTCNLHTTRTAVQTMLADDKEEYVLPEETGVDLHDDEHVYQGPFSTPASPTFLFCFAIAQSMLVILWAWFFVNRLPILLLDDMDVGRRTYLVAV